MDFMCDVVCNFTSGSEVCKGRPAYHAAQQPKDEKQEPTVVLTDDEQQQIDDVKSLKTFN